MPKTASAPPAHTFHLSISELKQRFASYNPRIHTTEDIQWTAESLLSIGWATLACINEETGTLVAGHGRVLASEYLAQQTEDWFDRQFQAWLQENPERPAIANKHKHRFTPSFWLEAPCVGIAVDETTEIGTNLRLNSIAKEGKDDKTKVAALLARLPQPTQEHAGYNKEIARSYIQAFGVRQENVVQSPPIDYQDKQVFTRSDATVYNADGDVVPPEEVKELDTLPEDWSVEVPQHDFNAVDQLDFEDPESFRPPTLDTDFAETRIVLLVTREIAADYPDLISQVADAVGVEQVGSSKVWRPEAVFKALRMVAKQAKV